MFIKNEVMNIFFNSIQNPPVMNTKITWILNHIVRIFIFKFKYLYI